MPTLKDGEFVLWEANAILFYMAARRPELRSSACASRVKDEGSRDLIRRPIETLRRQCEDFNA
jgi:glutathione S-transferase